MQIAEFLISVNQKIIYQKNEKGDTGYIIACKYDNYLIIDFLMKYKLKITK